MTDEPLPREALDSEDEDREELRITVPANVIESEVTSVAAELLPGVAPAVVGEFAHRLSASLTTQVVAVVKREQFSGPLPHPKHLKEYEDICTGAADRVLTMAEKSQDNLIGLQNRHLTLEYDDRRRGMWIGAVLFGCLVLGSLLLGLNGHPTLATLFLGAAALGVISLFIKGRGGDKDE